MGRKKQLYTAEELEEIASWCEERDAFMTSGSLPSRLTENSTAEWGKFVIGCIYTYFGFFPVMWVWLFCNEYSCPVFRQFSFDPSSTEELNMLCVVVSILMVVLAIFGVANIIGIIISTKEDMDIEKFMKEEVEKSKKITQAAVQETERVKNEQIQDLNNQLQEKEDEVDELNGEIDILKQELSDKEEEFENQISTLRADWKREERIWALEKKELEYKLTVKRGSDSK